MQMQLDMQETAVVPNRGQAVAWRFLDRLVERCEARGIVVVAGGSPTPGTARINLDVRQRWEFVEALAGVLPTESRAALLVLGNHRTSIDDLRKRQRSDAVDVGFFDAGAAQGDAPFSRVEIVYWRPTKDAPDGPIAPNRPALGVARVERFEDLLVYGDLDLAAGELRATVVTIADTGAAAALLDRIVARARAHGVAIATGGASTPGVLRVNLHVDQRPLFLEALAETLPEDGSIRLMTRADRPTPLAALLRRERSDMIDIGVVRHRSPDGREVFLSRIEIAYWRNVERFGSSRTVVNRPGASVSRVDRFEQIAGLADLGRPVPAYADPQAHDFPIDIVYTWVDGSDPVWAAEKDRHARNAGLPASAAARALHDERFQNRDELLYSLRSVEMFLPFVRTIHLVTADQVPSWLNVDHPRLRLVSHRDIYSDVSALPTFNSSSIETQLHHIDGLAEHFVYFNDDVFAGRLLTPGDFFTPNGLAKYYPSNNQFVPEFCPADLEEYAMADVRAVRLFRAAYGMSPTCLMQHAPHAARRSLLAEMEAAFGAEWNACAVERFRSRNDLRPIAFMHPHYAAHRGMGVPGEAREGYFALWYDDIAERLDRALASRSHKFFCINDAGVPEERKAAVDAIVARFLDAYFPIKSSFER